MSFTPGYVRRSPCRFPDQAFELKHQITDGCASTSLRKYTLSNPSQTLNQLVERIMIDEKQLAARSTEHVNKFKVLPPEYQSRKDAVFNYQYKEETLQSSKFLPQGQNDRERVCIRCGDQYPHAHECPAYQEESHKCGKMGHSAKLCRSGYRSEGRGSGLQGRKAQFSGHRFNRQDLRPQETVQRLDEPRKS